VVLICTYCTECLVEWYWYVHIVLSVSGVVLICTYCTECLVEWY